MAVPPTPTVEVAFGDNPNVASPTWTDISAYLESGQIKRGRDTELDDFSAGTCTLVLNNTDRRFDPLHTGGAYSPDVKPMVPIRVVQTYNAVEYPLFRGFVENWPQSYDAGDTRATTTIACVDGFAWLALETIDASPLEAEIRRRRPLHWWKMGEDAGTSQIEDSGSAPIEGTVVGAPTFGATGLDAGSSTTAVDFDGTDDKIKLASSPSPGSGDQSVFFLVNTDDNANKNVFSDGPGGSTISIQGGVNDWVGVGVGVSGTRYQNISNDASLLPVTTYNVLFAYRGSDNQREIYINAAEETNLEQTPGYSPQGETFIGGAVTPGTQDFWGGTLQHFVIFDSYLSSADATDLDDAARTAWDNDDTGTRAGRILDIVKWPTADRDVDTGIGTLEAATSNFAGSSALAYFKLLERTEGGQFFIAADGDFVFRNRHWWFTNTNAINVQATFSDDGSDIAYVAGGLRFDYDVKDIINQVEGQRSGGNKVEASDATSIDDYRVRSDSSHLSGVLDDNDNVTKAHAEWIVTRQKDPILRAEPVTVRPQRDPTNMFPAVLGREIGDRVNLERTPQATGSAIDQETIIEGLEHRFDPNLWQSTFRLSPAVTDTQVLVLDHATRGKMDDVNVLGF